jgi:hypothetical protein
MNFKVSKTAKVATSARMPEAVGSRTRGECITTINHPTHLGFAFPALPRVPSASAVKFPPLQINTALPVKSSLQINRT